MIALRRSNSEMVIAINAYALYARGVFNSPARQILRQFQPAAQAFCTAS